MVTRPYKRRRILIDHFQYRLMVINLLYFCTILLIFVAALFLPLILQLYSQTLSMTEQAEAASQFLSLHARVWPAVFVVFILLTVHSIFVSHRIAGPLYRFRGIFRAVAAGDLVSQVTLRKHDYLGKDLEVLNEMVASLRTKVKGIEEPYTEARALVIALERAIEGGSIEDTHQHMQGLRLQMERLQASLDQFRINHDGNSDDGEIAIPVASPSSSEDSVSLTRS
jgi:methyl-accepting chemotaxis protein